MLGSKEVLQDHSESPSSANIIGFTIFFFTRSTQQYKIDGSVQAFYLALIHKFIFVYEIMAVRSVYNNARQDNVLHTQHWLTKWVGVCTTHTVTVFFSYDKHDTEQTLRNFHKRGKFSFQNNAPNAICFYHCKRQVVGMIMKYSMINVPLHFYVIQQQRSRVSSYKYSSNDKWWLQKWNQWCFYVSFL